MRAPWRTRARAWQKSRWKFATSSHVPHSTWSSVWWSSLIPVCHGKIIWQWAAVVAVLPWMTSAIVSRTCPASNGTSSKDPYMPWSSDVHTGGFRFVTKPFGASNPYLVNCSSTFVHQARITLWNPLLTSVHPPSAVSWSMATPPWMVRPPRSILAADG